MKLLIRRLQSAYPKTFYQFTLVDIQFINTFQVWSVNLTILNFWFQLLHNKKQK